MKPGRGSYRLFQVDVFTRRPGAGNPAGVVPDARGLSTREMQRVAALAGHSETAFLLPGCGSDRDVAVRFFTPTTEVDSCGHATLAAHAVRHELGSARRVTRQRSARGLQDVCVAGDGDARLVTATLFAPSFSRPLDSSRRAALAAALGLGPEDLAPDLPLQVVDTASPKLVVAVRDAGTLDRLRPDLGSLADSTRRLGATGVYAFATVARHGDGTLETHGRHFAPAIGIPEDPVTGNANGALGAFAVRHGLAAPGTDAVSLICRQGTAVGRPGTVHVTVDRDGPLPRRVRIAGHAIVTMESALPPGWRSEATADT